MHTLFLFIFFTLFHMYFYFYYILLILTNKLGRHKPINVSFCKIKYLDLCSSLNFQVYLLVIVNNHVLFIYIDDY